VNEYASNVGKAPSPAFGRSHTHTAVLNYTHKSLPYAMWYQYLPTGNKTTPPLTVAATRGLWIERVDTSNPYVNVNEWEKLEGRMGSDAGELFQGDMVKLFNRNGRNNVTFFQGGIVDIRDPDRTFVRLFYSFTSGAALSGFTGFFNVVWNNTAYNFPGIEKYEFEMIAAADDSYDYNDYKVMAAGGGGGR